MLEQYIVQNDNLSSRIIDNEVIILTEDGHLHVLNEIASLIWQNADGKTKVSEITEKIRKEYEVDLETAKQDAIGFIKELKMKNLVTIV